MKRLTASAITLGSFLASAVPALALQLSTNQPGIKFNTSPSTIINNVLTLAYVIAVIIVLFFIVYGAFQWITSGGDKEKIKSARGTITNALIGLAILAFAALIVTVVGDLLGINVFSNFTIPRLDGTPTNI